MDDSVANERYKIDLLVTLCGATKEEATRAFYEHEGDFESALKWLESEEYATTKKQSYSYTNTRPTKTEQEWLESEEQESEEHAAAKKQSNCYSNARPTKNGQEWLESEGQTAKEQSCPYLNAPPTKNEPELEYSPVLDTDVSTRSYDVEVGVDHDDRDLVSLEPTQPGAIAVRGPDAPSNDSGVEVSGTTTPNTMSRHSTTRLISAELVNTEEEIRTLQRQIENEARRMMEHERESAVVAQVVVDKKSKCSPSRMRQLGIISVILVLVFVGIIVGLVVGRSSKDVSEDQATGLPTPRPTSQTFAELNDLISSVSLDQGAALEDESSPQYAALMWLEGNTNLEYYPNWKRIQRYVLAVLYYTTNGDSWHASDGWLSDEDECDWLTLSERHPVCNEDGTYYQITLSANNLKGTIPLELALLSNSLQRIYLDDNDMQGTIPTEMGLLTNVGFFSVIRNELTGTIPSELSLFHGVIDYHIMNRRVPGQFIDLKANQLSGSIPTVIFNPPQLSFLSLAENMLSGTIPSEIGLATELISAYFKESNLTGTLPTELGKLSRLAIFMSQSNDHTGRIPNEIGSCTKLYYFSAGENELTGSLPSELGLISDLEELRINDNMITGPLPSELGRLSLLSILHLENNGLTGTIPSAIEELHELDNLFLYNNSFTGSFRCPSSIKYCAISCDNWEDDACRLL